MSDNESLDPFEDGFERSELTVLDVGRYAVDPVFFQQTGLSGAYYDAYDVTVTNGQHRRKVVLSCVLNHLVQKRKIQTGTVVRLDKVRVRYDETKLDAPGIPVVLELTVIAQQDAVDLGGLFRLPWHPRDSSHQQALQPLASGRGCYIDLWAYADVANSAENFEVAVSSSLEDVTSEDLYSLQEVANSWQAFKAVKPRLLLRVMRRSKLLHFAQPTKTVKWPFQLHVVMGDETGCCVVVFWNDLAPRYLRHLHEGRVVLLRNYTVKPRFRMPEHPVLPPQGLPWYDVDININAHHPTGEITLLESSAIEDLHDVNLPLPVTNFVTRRQLSALPDGFVCDVAGLITFVGAVQREKMKGKSERFWIKRWIHVMDSSSDRPIIVQLYRGVEKEEFEEALSIGHFLVGRNMKVVHKLDQLQTSRETRHIYVTSSRETQIYVHEVDEDVDYPFASDAILRSAQRFAISAADDDADRGVLTQMLFSFPPQPTELGQFVCLHPNLEPTLSDGWESFVENLSYRETTCLVVQAFLVSVTFYEASHRRSTRSQRSQKQRAVMSSSLDDSKDDNMVYLGYNPSVSEPVVNLGDDSFFAIQWRGLNADVILNTMKPCHLHTCPADLSLQAFLSGAYDAMPWENAVNVSKKDVDTIVGRNTVRNSLSPLRFLVVLDVYCIDGVTAFLGINRAFPVSGVR